MNTRRATATHFGPLFITAFAAWSVFQTIASGDMHPIAGVLVSAALAYAGTIAALRWQYSAPSDEIVAPSPNALPTLPARITRRYQPYAAAYVAAAYPAPVHSYSADYEDVAAGD